MKNKEIILAHKEDLKKFEAKQKDLKLQRKTEKFVGTRTVDPYEAAYRVQENKFDLSVQYCITLMMKGWSVEDAMKQHGLECPAYIKEKYEKTIEHYEEVIRTNKQ